jgi:hypothetical protein
MKKLLLSLSLVLTGIMFAQAQIQTVSGRISTNTTWTNDKIYRMDGFIYVDSAVTLTIQPGTIIRGIKSSKGSLIVTRGGKLIAEGTASAPIVFTSDEPAGQRLSGDWGGLIILGNAPINVPGGASVIEGGVNNANGDGQYGGPDGNDSSGVIKYVRIEYAGIAFSSNNEINGITLGGVGRRTVMDYVQVSFSGDDSFEWFGGTVNGKHLIAHRGLDDDFDTDFGYNGNVQFGIIVRDPNVADAAGDSNGFESDNDGGGSTNTPKTAALFSNITIVGPKETPATVISTFFRRGQRIRRSSEVSTYNSIIMGWPTGIFVEGSACEGHAAADRLQMRNTILAGNTDVAAVATGSTYDVDAWLGTTAYGNSILTNNTDVMLVSPFTLTAPNVNPMVGSPALTGADFTNTRLANSFFTPTTFKGALSGVPAEDWTAGWANWDPSNTNYSTLPTVAGFSTVVANNVATFTNTSSNATSFSWSFGDGNTSTDANPSNTYTTNGTFKVKLTAINGAQSSVDSEDVVINVAAPMASFTFAADQSTNTAAFTNNSTSSVTPTYAWNFGDGSTSTDMNPSHTFAKDSTYNVQLTVTNQGGSDDTTIAVVFTAVGLNQVKGLGNVVLFPNPAADRAVLGFELTENAVISAKVFAIDGREVATVANQVPMSAGKHNLTVNAAALQAGSYIITIYNNEAASSFRFVVLK